MAGSSITFSLQGAERLLARLNRLGRVDRGMMEAVAAVGESQTRRRIQSEKRNPDGAPWPPWSRSYAATRGAQHSLLINEGHLLDSLTHDADSTEAVWGTNLIYAATHQFGDRDRHVPPRPFLGLSAENEAEILAVIEDWIERDWRGAT
ncbi:MAG: phage virion morphogenesis protein [Gammaproteobacteria bacterium]